ncbi:MAG TPA: heme-dependent oxidative N-demethylase subunit alpha family protein, partial [Kineobactrum sp.]
MDDEHVVTHRYQPLRYIPHMRNPAVLHMGLAPLSGTHWIEPDADCRQYYLHKLRQRERLGDKVYRALPGSAPAQRELAGLLAAHLLGDHAKHYRQCNNLLECVSGSFSVPLEPGGSLWHSALWVADDLVIMEPRGGHYILTAASLCSPSHWRLEDKFDHTLTTIHETILGF